MRCRVDREHAGQQKPADRFTDHVAFLYASGADVEDTLQASTMVTVRRNNCDVRHISNIFISTRDNSVPT